MIPSVAVLASNLASLGNTAPVQFAGGVCSFEVLAGNFNAGTVTLQKLGPDQVTWETVGASTTVTANAFVQGLNLPPGVYRLNASTAPTALYATLSASNN